MTFGFHPMAALLNAPPDHHFWGGEEPSEATGRAATRGARRLVMAAQELRRRHRPSEVVFEYPPGRAEGRGWLGDEAELAAARNADMPGT